MKFDFRVLSLIVVASMALGFQFAEPQSGTEPKIVAKQKEEPNVNMPGKIEQLEKRIDILESILFSTAKLESKRAQRLVNESRLRLRNSQSLFSRGLINRLQLNLDQLSVQIAERELALSKADSGHKRLVSELEVMDAKRTLQLAKNQFESQKNLAHRGYASQTDVDRYRKILDFSNLSLKNAEAKLKAASELESLESTSK